MKPQKRSAVRTMSQSLKQRLRSHVNQGRRETIYRMLMKKHDGTVPCFVCGGHVEKNLATLEHIVPLSKGGTDAMSNLSISHYRCNTRRGNCDAAIDAQEGRTA